ncbi:MAG TPA: alpha/beta fold hydrolase [Acidimicrobiia bacterium]
MTDRAVMPGAEPFSAAGGPHGALVLHGFTGCPQSMRPLAEAFAAAGFAVELPRLPGHGTSIDDMLGTGWSDWSDAADAAYKELASRCERVVVAGLSMGAALALWLATREPEVAGLVLVNPAVGTPGDDSMRSMLVELLDAGETVMQGLANDVADPDVTELAYDQTPIAGLVSLLDAIEELYPRLHEIACPLEVMFSAEDHVVPPGAREALDATITAPIEYVTLERSYHVATIDYDHELIERRAVEFAKRVTSG